MVLSLPATDRLDKDRSRWRVSMISLCCQRVDLSTSSSLNAWLIYAPHDIATLTFDLGGHGVCRWYGSSCSICVPSSKFVGIPVRKIWRLVYVVRACYCHYRYFIFIQNLISCQSVQPTWLNHTESDDKCHAFCCWLYPSMFCGAAVHVSFYSQSVRICTTRCSRNATYAASLRFE